MADTKVSKLTQIYKAEKAAGGGLATALGKASLEKIDPRQFFNQKSLLAAVFPSLFKAYKAPIKTDVAKTTPSIAQFSTSILESKIDDLSTHAKISAKNSLVLPSMARDMNLTRQNIAKLVKLQGGKPTYKSDMFFQRAAEREAAYESQFKRERPVGTAAATKPTPTKAEETGGGFFDKLLKGLAIGSLIGGLVFSAFKFLKDKVQAFYDDTVKQIEDIYNDIKSTVLTQFNKVKEKISNIIDEITIDNLKEATQSFLNRIVNAIKNIPTGFGGTPGASTTGGESPENPDITPSTVSPGLGAVQDEAERKGRVGPRGQQVEIKDGVVGYYRNVGRTGRGSQGKREFTPLQGEDLINYYSGEIKRVQRDFNAGETLNVNQLNNMGFAKTEGGKAAIERYMKENNITSPTPVSTAAPSVGDAAGLNTPQMTQQATTAASAAPTPAAPSSYPEQRFAGVTFRMLTKEQQNAVMIKQYEKEGNRPGDLAHDLKNPGAMLYDDNLGRLFGAKMNPTRGVEPVKGKFAEFPTLEAGFEAQRWKWLNAPIKGKYKYGDLPLDQSINLWTTGKIEGVFKTEKEKIGIENYKKGLYAAAGYEYTGQTSPVQMIATNLPQTKPITTTGTSLTSAAFQKTDKDITPVSTPVQTLAAVTPMPDTMKTVLRSEASKLNAATIEVAQARVQIGSAPIIVSPPAVNVQAPQIQAGGGGGMMAASSVVDTEFMKLLVGRTVTI